MASVGDRVGIGHPAPDTGRYKHSACSNTIIINKGEIMPPCGMGDCPNTRADWILNEKLT